MKLVISIFRSCFSCLALSLVNLVSSRTHFFSLSQKLTLEFPRLLNQRIKFTEKGNLLCRIKEKRGKLKTLPRTSTLLLSLFFSYFMRLRRVEREPLRGVVPITHEYLKTLFYGWTNTTLNHWESAALSMAQYRRVQFASKIITCLISRLIH